MLQEDQMSTIEQLADPYQSEVSSATARRVGCSILEAYGRIAETVPPTAGGFIIETKWTYTTGTGPVEDTQEDTTYIEDYDPDQHEDPNSPQ